MIVRIDGKIMLYCKGAGTKIAIKYENVPLLSFLFDFSDTIVFARLNQESQPLMKTTLAHLAVSTDVNLCKFVIQMVMLSLRITPGKV